MLKINPLSVYWFASIGISAMSRSVVLILTLGLSACGRSPRESGTEAGAQAQPDSGTPAAIPAETVASDPGHQIPVDSTKPTIPPAMIRDDSAGQTAGATVTVAHVLGSSELPGRMVQVTGTCLGYRVPPLAAGGPPRTRSDWQLENAGQAIYVTGPLPRGCSATEGSPSPVTITATVREDTLPAPGGTPGRARRYLEWKGP